MILVIKLAVQVNDTSEHASFLEFEVQANGSKGVPHSVTRIA
ncbi:conserved hypothetical protein [Listeria monocytogenes QOC1]|nr:conserved hypothetical protein [Listeria monocytogenes QOC1]